MFRNTFIFIFIKGMKVMLTELEKYQWCSQKCSLVECKWLFKSSINEWGKNYLKPWLKVISISFIKIG